MAVIGAYKEYVSLDYFGLLHIESREAIELSDRDA